MTVVRSTLLMTCWIPALVATGVQALLHPASHRRVSSALRDLGRPPLATLVRWWFMRIASTVLPITMGRGTSDSGLVRVSGELPALDGPCVLATYHSDWWRIVGAHLSGERGVAAIAGPSWEGVLSNVTRIGPRGGMRAAVDHLAAGHSVLLTTDHLHGDPAHAVASAMLGRPCRIPNAAARLAVCTGAALVPVSIGFQHRRIQVRVHSPVDPLPSVDHGAARVSEVLDASLGQEPESWRLLHRFLRQESVDELASDPENEKTPTRHRA